MNFLYIVWHTAAHATRQGVALDTSEAEICRWHIERGWTGTGYQNVIRFDGTIEAGRSYGRAGAHVAGLNSKAIGYCFSGHGDFAPLTAEQLRVGLDLTRQDMAKYNIPAENVIGHFEVNRIIQRDGLRNVPPVNKSCPGKYVDMDVIRGMVNNGTVPTTTYPLVVFANRRPVAQKALNARHLQTFLSGLGLYSDAIDGWPGDKTSDALEKLVGHKLQGDPRT